MLTKLRNRLTYANVVATLALFVALGGSSYAAIALKRGSVKGKHLAKNAVTAPKVRNASLLSEDFAPGQLPQGEQGQKGEQGQTGDKGDKGDAGEPGSAIAYASVTAAGALDPGSAKNVNGVTKACEDTSVIVCSARSVGIYCLDLATGVSPHTVISGRNAGGWSNVVLAATLTPGTDTSAERFCPAPHTDASVSAYAAGDAAQVPVDTPFYVVFN